MHKLVNIDLSPDGSPFVAWTITVLFGLVLLSTTIGCATVEVIGIDHLNDQQITGEASPVAHIYADNWGLYLFKYIPFITGNLKNPGIPQWPRLFTHNVKPDLLAK
jgi:hypothetical protein